MADDFPKVIQTNKKTAVFVFDRTRGNLSIRGVRKYPSSRDGQKAREANQILTSKTQLMKGGVCGGPSTGVWGGIDGGGGGGVDGIRSVRKGNHTPIALSKRKSYGGETGRRTNSAELEGEGKAGNNSE